MPNRRSKVNPAVRVRNLPTYQYRVVTESEGGSSSEEYRVYGIKRVVVLPDSVHVYDAKDNRVVFANTTSYCMVLLPDIGVEVEVTP